MRIKKFILGCVMGLILACAPIHAQVSTTLAGNTPEVVNTNIPLREFLKQFSRGGYIHDMSGINLASVDNAVLSQTLMTFNKQYTTLYTQYNATSDAQGGPTYEQRQAFWNSLTTLVNQANAHLTTNMTAVGFLQLQNYISQHSSGIFASSIDPMLGATVASRNLKERNMMASSMPMPMPQSGNNMSQNYSGYYFETVGTYVYPKSGLPTFSSNLTQQDTFPFASGNLSTVDSQWLTDAGQMWVESGKGVEASATGRDEYEFTGFGTTPWANQCAFATVSVGASGAVDTMGVAVRLGSNGQGYVFGENATQGVLSYLYAPAPNGTTLGTASHTWADGDVIGICAVGDYISGSVNGQILVTAQDTHLATGLPGLWGNYTYTTTNVAKSFVATGPVFIEFSGSISGDTNCVQNTGQPNSCPSGAFHKPSVTMTNPSGIYNYNWNLGSYAPFEYFDVNQTWYVNGDEWFDGPDAPDPDPIEIAGNIDCTIIGPNYWATNDSNKLPWNLEYATSLMRINTTSKNPISSLKGLIGYVQSAIAFPSQMYTYALGPYCTAETTLPDWNPSTLVSTASVSNFVLTTGICDALPIVGEMQQPGVLNCAPVGFDNGQFSLPEVEVKWPDAFTCTVGFDGPKFPPFPGLP
jgi:hypothetical protein